MIRPTIDALPASRIREVANAGIGRSDILKFWFGEGDQVTPGFIRDAAKSALAKRDPPTGSSTCSYIDASPAVVLVRTYPRPGGRTP